MSSFSRKTFCSRFLFRRSSVVLIPRAVLLACCRKQCHTVRGLFEFAPDFHIRVTRTKNTATTKVCNVKDLINASQSCINCRPENINRGAQNTQRHSGKNASAHALALPSERSACQDPPESPFFARRAHALRQLPLGPELQHHCDTALPQQRDLPSLLPAAGSEGQLVLARPWPFPRLASSSFPACPVPVPGLLLCVGAHQHQRQLQCTIFGRFHGMHLRPKIKSTSPLLRTCIALGPSSPAHQVQHPSQQHGSPTLQPFARPSSAAFVAPLLAAHEVAPAHLLLTSVRRTFGPRSCTRQKIPSRQPQHTCFSAISICISKSR